MSQWKLGAALLNDYSALIGGLGEVLLQQRLYEALSPQEVFTAALHLVSYIHA
ncbi:hypothetical protein [Pseudomonas serbica]|uniref:hypothetical protein n=1 Tax=Pseudomonas serbica TaxID=2965074 RepID=UPI00237A2A65|nr:hypothetical protein [Pseudomonas serbica]